MAIKVWQIGQLTRPGPGKPIFAEVKGLQQVMRLQPKGTLY
jgi:hypothetical protein